jgi:Fic family protein
MRRIAVYIHQRRNCPRFRWDRVGLADQLAEARHRQGRLIGRMEALGFRFREEAVLNTLTQDVLKSSEIEEEVLGVAQVRSALARRLGLDIGALTPADRQFEGVVENGPDRSGAEGRPGAPLVRDRSPLR